MRGQVQGVGYRFFVRQEARSLNLRGWVSNEPDGSVCGEASGPDALLSDFHATLLKGPAFASVTGLDWQALDEGKSLPQPFEIRP